MACHFDLARSVEPAAYRSFLLAAVKSLYFDPWRRISFAVIPNRKLASRLAIDTPESPRIYTWNETIVYSGQLNDADAFVKWIFHTAIEKGDPLVEWITSSGLKSDLFTVKLAEKPTLILFTPRSLILGISPYFDVVSRFFWFP